MSEDNLIQPDASRGLPQRDQLHSEFRFTLTTSEAWCASCGTVSNDGTCDCTHGWAGSSPDWQPFDRRAMDEIASLRSRVEALKTALAPFVEAYDKHAWAFLDISDADAERHFLEGEASLADLRRARSVLSEKQP